MKKIVVGSTNPVKVDATRQAFEAVWPKERFTVEGVKVDSGVSDQPMSFEETIRGAKNRARAAMLLKQTDFAVGLEAGADKMPAGWFETGWCAVLDADGTFGVGSSPVIAMGGPVMDRILEGKELGDVIDDMTARSGVKHQEGFFGIMTNGAVTRTDAFRIGIIFALARFAQPEFFAEPSAHTEASN
ncbi:MAG TPA: inosine/xanthosine triphosphatase [Patescibacteria group bacterium]